ncbi:hypothetical protein [Cyprinid herpesvirus 2]|uniref:Uncharacterized protein n=1 Tax=Cyprinid herpesvirus 2 TaxID=317878 RepID=A0A0E3T6S0_CYHV2|nr:hypothetical protein [Cyprinid herpesvirus 2]
MDDDVLDLEALDDDNNSDEELNLSSGDEADYKAIESAPMPKPTAFLVSGLGQTKRDTQAGAGVYKDTLPVSLAEKAIPDVIKNVLDDGQRAVVFADLTGGKKLQLDTVKLNRDLEQLKQRRADLVRQYNGLVANAPKLPEVGKIDTKLERERSIWSAKLTRLRVDQQSVDASIKKTENKIREFKLEKSMGATSKRGRQERAERANKRTSAKQIAETQAKEDWSDDDDDSSDDDDNVDMSLVPHYIETSDFAGLFSALGPVIFGPRATSPDPTKLSSNLRALVLKETAQCLFGPALERRDVKKRIVNKPRDAVSAELEPGLVLETTSLVKSSSSREGSAPVKIAESNTFSVHDPNVYCALLAGPVNAALCKHMPTYFVDFRFNKADVTLPFASPWMNPTATYNSQVYFKGSKDTPILKNHMTLSLFSIAVNSCTGKTVLSDQEVGMVAGVFYALDYDVASTAKVCLSMASVLSRGITGHPSSVSEKVMYHFFKRQAANNEGVKPDRTAHLTFVLGCVFLFGGPLPRCTWWLSDEFFHKCLATRLKWPLFGRIPYHINLLEQKASEVNLFQLRKDVFISVAKALTSFIEAKQQGCPMFKPLHSTSPMPPNPNSIYIGTAMSPHIQRMLCEVYVPASNPNTTAYYSCKVADFVTKCLTLEAVAHSQYKPGTPNKFDLPRAGMLWLSCKFTQQIFIDGGMPPEQRTTTPGYEKLIFQDFDYVCNSVETPGYNDPAFKVTTSLCELSYNLNFLFSKRVLDKAPASSFMDPMCMAGRVAQDIAMRSVEPTAHARNMRVWALQYAQIKRLKQKWLAKSPALGALMTWAPYINETSPLMYELASVDGPPVMPQEARHKTARVVNSVRGYLAIASFVDDVLFRNKKKGQKSTGGVLPDKLPVPDVSKFPLKDLTPTRASASASASKVSAALIPATMSTGNLAAAAAQEEDNIYQLIMKEEKGLVDESSEGALADEEAKSRNERAMVRFLKDILKFEKSVRDSIILSEADRVSGQGNKELAAMLRAQTQEYRRKALLAQGMAAVRATGPLANLEKALALLSDADVAIKVLLEKKEDLLKAPDFATVTGINISGVTMPSYMRSEASDMTLDEIEEAISEQRLALRAGLSDAVKDAAMGLYEESKNSEHPVTKATELDKRTLQTQLRRLINYPDEKNSLLDLTVNYALANSSTEQEQIVAKTWELTVSQIRTAAKNLRDEKGNTQIVDLDFTDEDELPDELKEERRKVRAKRREYRKLIKNNASEKDIVLKALQYNPMGPVYNVLTPEEQANLSLAIERIGAEHDELDHLMQTAGIDIQDALIVDEGSGLESQIVSLIDRPKVKPWRGATGSPASATPFKFAPVNFSVQNNGKLSLKFRDTELEDIVAAKKVLSDESAANYIVSDTEDEEEEGEEEEGGEEGEEQPTQSNQQPRKRLRKPSSSSSSEEPGDNKPDKDVVILSDDNDEDEDAILDDLVENDQDYQDDDDDEDTNLYNAVVASNKEDERKKKRLQQKFKRRVSSSSSSGSSSSEDDEEEGEGSSSEDEA